jgi:toxin YxiD
VELFFQVTVCVPSLTGSKGVEQVLETVKSYEQARNKAFDIIGDLGSDAKPYIGRLGTVEGKIVGMQSADGKVRWRLDFDPSKGPHINVEDFRNGKGTDAIKIAMSH